MRKSVARLGSCDGSPGPFQAWPEPAIPPLLSIHFPLELLHAVSLPQKSSVLLSLPNSLHCYSLLRLTFQHQDLTAPMPRRPAGVLGPSPFGTLSWGGFYKHPLEDGSQSLVDVCLCLWLQQQTDRESRGEASLTHTMLVLGQNVATAASRPAQEMLKFTQWINEPSFVFYLQHQPFISMYLLNHPSESLGSIFFLSPCSFRRALPEEIPGIMLSLYQLTCK